MSIRLRFTLLYNAILALTLAIFGLALYFVLAKSTYKALQGDILHSSEKIGGSIQQLQMDPGEIIPSPPTPDSSQDEAPQPQPFEDFSGAPDFQHISEREIVRILDASGNLVVSPRGSMDEALPLSPAGLQALRAQRDWWEAAPVNEQPMLIYSRPIIFGGKLEYILQVARPLTEQNRSLEFLAMTFLIASVLTILIAFGIGWLFSGVILSPITRLTHTAQVIGEERNFTRRVNYTGPADEVGQLATTFNGMLARLQDAYQQVAHALELQRNFVADVSHELRTPLTTLRGNLGLLGRTPPIPPDEQADILMDMVDESDRLIRLVNDLLVLARADAGPGLALEEVQVSPVLEEALRQARLLEPARNISLQAESASVWANRDALKQVVLVGLDNALKHSPADVRLKVFRQSGQVEIRVEDDGPGIPAEKLERIFERFYRGEENVTLPGFGLGLSIARATMEAMHGTVAMESEPGKGSVLVLRLPEV